jgi:flagella basal body P-ring formation protein FlgA
VIKPFRDDEKMTPNMHTRKMSLNISKLIPVCLLALCLLASQSVLADSVLHSHNEIKAAAEDFVRAQIPEDITIKAITAGKIDSRLKFTQCSQPLDLRSTMNRNISKSWTIGIRCNDAKAWSLYLPVKADLTRKMLLSSTTITRGEIITADKIKLVDQPIRQHSQKHFSKSVDVIGRQARTTIRPDRIINSSMLQQAYLVKKREAVLIYAQNSKLRISMQGTALKNGRHNEMIKVRNNSSKKIIEVRDFGISCKWAKLCYVRWPITPMMHLLRS